ncbi:phospholipid-transporting ATPase IF-like isoform X2 [Amphiura filiformis]|uniref:phospholipid-transporting ATPase IF-like isoform X2 n=1 Tax=Amphiura filiformis TaxID=82378 RepID=UPI003B20C8CA
MDRPSFMRNFTDTLGCTQPEVPDSRTVCVGNRKPPAADPPPYQAFCNNRVISYKYTKWSFLPKNLFEQFQRIANFYFLCVAVLQLAIDSPVSPITSILPLVFVISVTAVKQAYEDWLRHKADNEVNGRKTSVVRNGRIQEIKSHQIMVGDIVRVEIEQELPCDMVLLSTESEDGECYVTTANLDGETNLKLFRSLPDTTVLQDAESLESLEAVVECEQPQADLYKFVGRMKFYKSREKEPEVKSLAAENVLLRGCRLKNTPYVFGVAVYTGKETKMALNSKQKGQKFSSIEKSMNYYLIVMLIWLLFQTSLSTGLKYWSDKQSNAVNAWYYRPVAEFKGDYNINFGLIFTDFLSFLVLFNYIIPISMYVTIEMQKFIGSKYIAWDLEMYDEDYDEPAIANTSDLNEELGQVEYMFTDKTGTLTENDMQFRQCSIAGVRYKEVDGKLEPVNPELHAQEESFKNFLLAMALCHTVHVHKEKTSNSNGNVADRENNYNSSGEQARAATNKDTTQMNGHLIDEPEELDYQASSPDEKALVEAARRYGVTFTGGTQEYLEVLVGGDRIRYQILHVLEFDPTRKCMSIILQTPGGDTLLICKGAESTILERSTSGDKDMTLQHVNEYAMEGLRTLCFGHRKLSSDEYDSFNKQLHDASTALDDRDGKLAVAFGNVEANLHLLGATGVEDRLQDGVPETIQALREAGIKVWVLTGDKQETAVNISHSCSHFKPAMREITCVKQENTEQCGNTLWRITEQMQLDPNQQYALTIDGMSLVYALGDHLDTLREICLKCVAVLCCRMSPLQKAKVVKLVKLSPSKPSTMAIGDGANDVSMIQEAHLGIGIMGKEGRQAVRCSDYAFAKFRFLQKMLLVHGAWYYIRIATTVQYFMYKNLAFITAQLYYAFLSQFSEQTVYDSFFLTFYNITCTSLPIFIYGIMEQHIRPSVLSSNPSLYKENARNNAFSLRNCLYWCLLGVWHSLVFFYGNYFLFHNEASFNRDGEMVGLITYGTMVFTTTVLIVNFKLCLEICYWNWIAVVGMVISIFGYPILTALYGGILWYEVLGGWEFFEVTTMYRILMMSLSSWTSWFLLLGLTVISFLPDYVYKMTLYYFHPSEQQKARRRTELQMPHPLARLIPGHSDKLVITQSRSADSVGIDNPAMIDSISRDIQVEVGISNGGVHLPPSLDAKEETMVRPVSPQDPRDENNEVHL